MTTLRRRKDNPASRMLAAAILGLVLLCTVRHRRSKAGSRL